MTHTKYFIYIITNKNQTTLYTGMTNNLLRRIMEHRNGEAGSFSQRYKLKKLVYFETYPNKFSAILREKQIKAGSRKKKLDLINSLNPGWKDLLEFL